MNRKWRHQLSLVRNLYLMTFLLSLAACGDDGGGGSTANTASATPARKEPPKAQETTQAALTEDARPEGRLRRTLTRDDFAFGARDPFDAGNSVSASQIAPDVPRDRQRDVRMPNYDFEDLRLIAIVRSGRSIPPRALFVANDGVSKSIQQGEYFSRSEILLAAVNSDYIEIEIVDEVLAQSLNMEQGERRAIYLKQD